MSSDEWEDEQAEAELANIKAGIREAMTGPPTRWLFPLQTDYVDGRITNTIRHYGPRHDELDWEALNRLPKGAPIPQDVLVYVAAKRGIKPGEYPLASRSATARRDIAVAAGTGLALRVFVPKGTVLEPVPIAAGEPPTEEVLLPEGASMYVYAPEEFESRDMLDAELFPR